MANKSKNSKVSRQRQALNLTNYKSWPGHRPLVERIHRVSTVRTGVPIYHPEREPSSGFWNRFRPRPWFNREPHLPTGQLFQLEQLAQTLAGTVPHLVAYTASVPWVTRMALMSQWATGASMDPEIKALTAYFQNRDAACRYGFGLAIANLRRNRWDSIRISRLTKSKSGVMNSLQQAAIRYAVKTERFLPVSTSIKQFTKFDIDENTAADILTEPFFQTIHIRLALALGLPPEEMIEEAAEKGLSLNQKIIRGMLSVVPMHTNERQMRRTIAAFETAPGAFATLVDTNFPGKAGRRLHTMLSEAFNSPIFEFRTKALMVCAAGRGMNSEYLEAAGREVLANEEVPQSIINELLDRRFTEALGEIENAVCEFVRLSIQPDANVFYQKAETLRQVLTEKEMIELAGFTALLNGVGRMISYGRSNI